ncbi:TRAP-type C4-dicarboxylate transport system [Striga asiatica]|uniref:TRAP-type C4-dicarboxylate transport system n=1 Tax=Striga asiatica TaxID=4170 RepID=A0A5A7PU83_STRAF|nr:TRAP-type C4-dicarboxylate transport system [Striga asiatica]
MESAARQNVTTYEVSCFWARHCMSQSSHCSCYKKTRSEARGSLAGQLGQYSSCSPSPQTRLQAAIHPESVYGEHSPGMLAAEHEVSPEYAFSSWPLHLVPATSLQTNCLWTRHSNASASLSFFFLESPTN